MDKAHKTAILDILSKQNDMTIATLREDGYPQATTVGYVNDGLDIIFACWTGSQKAKNIARHDKVSLTVTASYEDWSSIKGLSIGGTAGRVTSPDEIRALDALFLKKFPQAEKFAPEDRSEMVYFRVKPKVFSVLDYTKGFGHADLVAA